MKKKGNKKMPMLRQEIIDNPIPTSLFISPRHEGAASVMVVVLCVCGCVRVCLLMTILMLQATTWLMSDIKCFSVTSA